MTTTPASSKRDRAPWILAGPLGCLTACFLLALAGVTANLVLGQDRTMALVSRAATSTREPAVLFQPTIPSKTTAPVSLPTTVITTEWPRPAQPAGPADSANPRLFSPTLNRDRTRADKTISARSSRSTAKGLAGVAAIR